mgnify:FL=1
MQRNQSIVHVQVIARVLVVAAVLQRAITNAMLVVKMAVNTVVDQHVIHLATDDKMLVVL